MSKPERTDLILEEARQMLLKDITENLRAEMRMVGERTSEAVGERFQSLENTINERMDRLEALIVSTFEKLNAQLETYTQVQTLKERLERLEDESRLLDSPAPKVSIH